MKYYPATETVLEHYEAADGAGLIGIANERGDITAYVGRSDGTHGVSYGGPVYDPPYFLNICQRSSPFRPDDWECPHTHDLTAAERAVAHQMARKVAWLP